MNRLKSILVVEDDDAIREMVKTLLEIEGYLVYTAANGREGVRALQSDSPPEIVLLDMMMPVMNGWDFLDILKNDPKTRDIPVVIISAFNEIAKSVNPKCIVPKPIQLDTLLKAIEKCAA